MFSRSIKTAAAYMLVLLLATSAFGQQPQGQTPPKPDPQYVDFSGFKGKVIEVKNRDAFELARVLNPLSSGYKGSTIVGNTDFKTIVVRDFPENIAAIEEAVKRLDVPLPTQPDHSALNIEPNIELVLHVLIASNVEGASNPHPEELNEVLKQLRTKLTYKNYYLLTSIVQRTKIGQNTSNIQGEGLATAGAQLFGKNEVGTQYVYSINQIYPELRTAGAPMAVRNFSFLIKGASAPDDLMLGSAKIYTNLSVRDGEQVVVGTASLKDKGLILVLSAKVLK